MGAIGGHSADLFTLGDLVEQLGQAAKSKEAGEAGAAPAVAPQDRVARLAAWLNSGAYVPPGAVTNTTRDALLRAGLVTEATLRARQIY